MKYSLAATLLLASTSNVCAFTPNSLARAPRISSTFEQNAIVDPSILTDAHHHVDAISSVLSSIALSDAADAIADAVPAVSDNVVSAVTENVVPEVTKAVSTAAAAAAPAADVVAETTKDNGWFGFLEGPIEFLLTGIHGALVSMGMSENAWGVSIIAMTTLIKLVTYPLNKNQLESTNKMQALGPEIKAIQAKYQSNPELANQKIAQIYQDNDFNPLAGCLPLFLQLPVFLGLYRAVLTLASDDKLNEPFLYLPNLEGPTYGLDPTHGLEWISQGWVDGVPALGWEDTLAFLTIPLILVVSQSISMNLMASKDQEQPAFLKILPLFIGYVSLTFPAALGIYWIANNFITTALTLQIRSSLGAYTPVSPSTSGGAAVVDATTTTFTPAPIREKPSGFGDSELDVDGIKPITPMDAEVVTEEAEEVAAGVDVPKRSNKGSKKKKKGKRGKKKKN